MALPGYDQLYREAHGLPPAPAKPTASSALAPVELQAQSARCPVATGSLWVSAGLLLQLQRAWKSAAANRREKAAIIAKDDLGHTLTDALYDQAQTLDDCAEELRLLTEDAGVRQPTENK